MFIFNKNNNYRLNSIITSKLLRKQRFKNLNFFFVVKNQKKDQVLFYFIVLYLMSGKCPKIVKKKIRKKLKFLGFFLLFNIYFLYTFIIMQFSILDTIAYLKTKSNREHNLIFKEFPILYEIDTICERYNPLLEFIKSYKFILNIKIVPRSYIWIDSEFIIRLFKLPYIDNLR
jgi:hypothetical protein